MGIGLQVVISAVGGLISSALTYWGVKKWGMTTNHREEIALFLGLAVAIIIFLLLQGQPASASDQPPAGVPATGPTPEPGPTPPTSFPVGPDNIGLIQTQAPSVGNCNCSCDQTNVVLSDAYTQLAQQFVGQLNQDQEAIYMAQVAAIPGLTAAYEAAANFPPIVTGGSIYSPSGPGPDVTELVAPGITQTKVWG